MICRRFGTGRRDLAPVIQRIVADGAGEQPTYDHVGSTIDPGAWPACRPYVRLRVIGHDRSSFDAAVAGLRGWACHAGVRARVHPPDAAIVVGTTVAVELPAGLWRIIVPNRIVAVIDEPDQFGFAYGTLPGHEERGEEGFVVEMAADGRVTATVRVDAVPASLAARLAGPAVTLIQHWAVGRYLDAWARFVTERTASS